MRKIAFWLSLVLLFIIPWEDTVSINTTGNPDDAASLTKFVGLGLAGLWFATMLLEGRFRKFHRFHAVVFFFFLVNIYSYLWSPNQYDTSYKVKTYAQILLLVLIFWELYQKPSEVRAGLQAYVLGGYVLIINTLVNYISGVSSVEYETRFAATGVNAVESAVLLLLGLPFAWYLFSTANKQKDRFFRTVNIIFLPLSIFATFLSGSRTSLFAIIPPLLFIFWPKKITISIILRNVAIVMVMLLVIIIFMPAGVVARLSTASDSISSADLGNRVPLWLGTLRVFLAHPILGNGSGTLYTTIGTEAHNTLFSILGETGLVGFFFYVLVLAIVVNEIMRLPKGQKGLWVTIFCIWFIGSSLLAWEYKKATWILLSLVVINSSSIRDYLHSQRERLEISRLRKMQSLDGAEKPAV